MKMILGMILILMTTTTFGMTTTPTIKTNGAEFLVEFDPGAIWACTTYRLTEPTEEKSETFPDGHYAPKHCWALGEDETHYIDDWDFIEPLGKEWDVWADIGYQVGHDTIEFESTNRVRVTR